jgi:hypothetical protein
MLSPLRAVCRNLRCGYGRAAARKGLVLAAVTNVDRLCQRLTAHSERQPNLLRALRENIPPQTRGATDCQPQCRLRGTTIPEAQS